MTLKFSRAVEVQNEYLEAQVSLKQYLVSKDEQFEMLKLTEEARLEELALNLNVRHHMQNKVEIEPTLESVQVIRLLED